MSKLVLLLNNITELVFQTEVRYLRQYMIASLAVNVDGVACHRVVGRAPGRSLPPCRGSHLGAWTQLGCRSGSELLFWVCQVLILLKDRIQFAPRVDESPQSQNHLPPSAARGTLCGSSSASFLRLTTFIESAFVVSVDDCKARDC